MITLPHNLEAEMAVLGAMMLYTAEGQADAIATTAETLDAADFYRDGHAEIFTAVLAISGRAETVDPVTVKAELERRGTFDRIGGTLYLMQLGDVSFTTSGLADYVTIVREKAQRRRLIDLLHDTYTLACLPEDAAPNLLGDFEAKLLALQDDRRERETTEMLDDVLHGAVCDFADYAKNYGHITGIPTGFPDLDRMISGFQRGDLVIIAARPSMGKTSLATQMFADVCLQGRSAVFESAEMTRPQIGRRMACNEARVDALLAQRGMAGRTETAKFGPMLDRFENTKGAIDDSPHVTLRVIDAICRRHKAKHGLDALFVDYLQLIGLDSKRTGDRNAEITEITKGLKSLARKYDIPVVVLCQLSRAVEKREDKHPMLSDLRDSGSIEAEADIVLFPFRPDYYNRNASVDPDRFENAELMVAKNRNGPTGSVTIGWIPKFARFESVLEPQGIF